MNRFGSIATIFGALLALTAAPALCQIYLELALFDRKRPDCDGIPIINSAAESDYPDCGYDGQTTVNLEHPPLSAVPWVRLLLRSEIRFQRSGDWDERGHVRPIKSDIGVGLVLDWDNLKLTLLGSSKHCMDLPCPKADAYNALILRWTPVP